MDSRRFAVLCVILVLLVPVPPPAVAQQPYVLGPEDVIEVTVYGHPDLTRAVAISPDGKIALPLIGSVAAAGLSIEGLTQALIHAYEVYIRNPQVTVIVKEFRRLRVSVIGHVVRPGVYELKPGAAVLEALSAAGGLTERASMAQAQLVRASGESQPLARDMPVQAGDIIVVPEGGLNAVGSVVGILAGLATIFK